MEEYKQRYLQYFLHRNNKVSLEDYVEKIKAQELHGCYGNAQHLKSNDKFLPLFILEDLFDASKVRVKNSEDDELEWTEPPLHFVDFIRTLHVQYLDTGTSEAGELP
ncbi:hypothetical protein L3X38_007939 [Prunus dulcis]|uniref:Uncharacterized protein n=1 Tax=Prunus dulcis TaxID=3755 RepID=A0AAD4ZVP9_PRUDU|nr:hypothetical protein L3X38_007939 [Prunus dulcis]